MDHSIAISCVLSILVAATPALGQKLSGTDATKQSGDGQRRAPSLGSQCEIIMPPGSAESTFEATLWRVPLVNGGPQVLGVVPYEFDPALTPAQMCQVEDAMDEIERVSDVQFIPRQPFHNLNWITVRPCNVNASLIGMWNNPIPCPPNNPNCPNPAVCTQEVRIATWLTNGGQIYDPCALANPQINFTIVHELLHTLGYWHEHQRPDRNNFVQINTQCILPGAQVNFDINTTAQMIGLYDFESVLHYGQFAFSNGCPTITVLPPNQQWQNAIGQRQFISQTDIDGLCQLYGCTPVNNTCATATFVTNGTTITDTRGSSTSAGATCSGLQRDVWYIYDAACTGQVTMSLDNPSGGYTPALAVYDDPCGGSLVSCDISAPLTATFPVNAGERYRIRVGGLSNSTGTARLQIACAPINCTTGLQWAQVATTGPGMRRNHNMCYDSTNGQAVLFGGVEGITELGDTWEWDSASLSWALTSTTGPSPRMHHAMAYDSARQRVVLFGGYPSLGDTWEYDPVTNQWLLRSSTGPSGRWGHRMAYDSARQRVVMFGGSTAGSGQDTWEWNGATGAWTMVNPLGPPARTDFGMAYDSNRGVTVMWGGTSTNDTSVWEWNGTSWTQHAVPSPTHRSGHKLVYDSTYQQVMMFGGWNPGPTFYNDLWVWNGTAWNSLGNSGAPPGRAWFAAAYDTSAAAMLIHGGSDGFQLVSDTWRVLPSGITNDDYAGAQLVANGTTSIDNRCASNSAGSCANERDIWYRYTATVSGTLTASVTGASFNPRVAIYDAANPTGAPLACGTGSPPVATTVMLPGDYLIRVGSAPGQSPGVGNLVINGLPQPCPPVFNINDFSTFKHRLFEVTGTSNGLPWAWSIHRGSDLMFELNVPALPVGANAHQLAAAFAAAINAHPCADNRLWAVQLNSPYQNKFRVIVGGNTNFDLCMGPAGQLPSCCLPQAGYCTFNPDVREIFLSERDCNQNGMDDTIDLLEGTSLDLNENGVPDDCEAGKPCPADLDGDNIVGFEDFTFLLASWGECPNPDDCPADLDHDGMVGFEDFTFLLASWGECP